MANMDLIPDYNIEEHRPPSRKNNALVRHFGVKNDKGIEVKSFDIFGGAAVGLTTPGSPRNGYYAYQASTTAKRCVKIRADAVAQVPLKLYDKNSNEIESHKILDLLKNVNEDENWNGIIRNTESDLQCFPYAIWAKGRETVSGRGKVLKLYRLNPAYTALIVNVKDGVIDWYFRYQPPNGGRPERYERNDVVYFHGLYNPLNDIWGLAPLAGVHNACLAELEVSRYLNSFFENGALPGLVMTSEQPVGDSDVQRVTKQLDSQLKGVSRWFKTLVMGNTKNPPTLLGYNVKDLDLATVRQELVKEICKSVDVPEILINSTNSADLTPLKLAQTLFWTGTIVPQLDYYSDNLNGQLVTEFPDLVAQEAYLAFDPTDIIKSIDSENNARYQEDIRKDYEAGIISGDAARRELGYNEDDAPEEPVPAPLPEAPTPMVDQNPPLNPNTTPGQVPAPTPGQTPAMKSDDVTKWRRKALKALGDGRSPAVTFESSEIDAETNGLVLESLILADGRDEVLDVFSELEIGYLPGETKSVWSTQYKNSLPDSAFLFIEAGGEKDSSGRTVPRSKRHFPYKNAAGKIDRAHLRDAIGRIAQSNAKGLDKAAVQKRAQAILQHLVDGDAGKETDEP